jgi:hypothetical protein
MSDRQTAALIRTIVDPLLLKFREDLFGSGVSFGVVSPEALPSTIIYNTNIDQYLEDAGFMENPMTSTGDLIRGGIGGDPTRLPIGSEGYVLTVSGGLPVWSLASGTGGFNNPMTTTGDIIYGTTGGAAARLAIGSTGQVLMASGGLPVWADNTGGGGGGGTVDYVHIRDEKAQNTSGGTFSAGSWVTRDLNTEVTDTGGHASIASNQITLAAGTWYIQVRAPAFAVNRHQIRLRNITDSTTLLTGISSHAAQGNNVWNIAVLDGRFTIAAPKVIEVQHQCETGLATRGLGVEGNFTTEVYTVVELWKIA